MTTWRNYDEVVTTLLAHGFKVTHLEIGRMQRVARPGHDQKGWYVLHEITLEDNSSALIGSFGYWTGAEKFKEKISAGKGIKLTKEQELAIKARHAEAVKKAEFLRQQQAELASKKATFAWSKYTPNGESPYLKRKNVNAYGLRFAPSANGTLAIPMQDTNGKIWGLQIIRGNERGQKLEKQYWPSGLNKKASFYLIGGSPKGILLIAEGYATAASLHEATGFSVAVAFDAGNLMPVAMELHKKYRGAKILICADDDYLTENNPGCKSAEAAALAVNGAWIKPEFPADREGKKLTDFNDLANFPSCSLSTVLVQIEDKIHSLGWGNATASAVALKQGGGEASIRGSLKPLIEVDEFVERFSLIYGGGATMYDHEEFALVPKSDVLDICVEHAFRDSKRYPNRSVVRLSEVGFDPTEKDKEIICNLWGGWPTKPKEGSCAVLLDLLEHLCSGEDTQNKAVYEWVLKWLAYPIQHPGAKMKTALIFHGAQGAGKNLFFESYAKIFGRYARIVGQAEIDDKFNDWASGKLFLIADEVVARQELFHIKNKLKALITGDNIRINPKNVAAHDEKNHVNIVFLSNEKQPLVLERDDRRYTVIWTPPPKSKNYYTDIAEEINAGGIEALHHYLLNLDLGDFNEHSKPPMTQSKQDLININLESIDRFIEQYLAGDLDLPVCPCESSDLYTAYNQWCRDNGVSRPRESNQMLGTIIKMPGWKTERKRIFQDFNFSGEAKQRSILFPPENLYQQSHQKSENQTEREWMTVCVLDFKDQLRGKNE